MKSRKPDWLKVRFPAGPEYARIDRYHRQQGLHSVCRSAACPNQGECWSRGTATFMILGDRCTRDCRFCNVVDGSPLPPDPQEPAKVAAAIAELGLRHAVITSVTRDDLPDGGASHFARLTEEVRKAAPGCRVELLIPDLQGSREALATILSRRPRHPRAQPRNGTPALSGRAAGAVYRRSLELLTRAREVAPAIPTKSGLMLGLGEADEEVSAVLSDLRRADCALLTLGQYLAPTRDHHPVERYVSPEAFADWRRRGLALGFDHVEAGPLVRSSYHAEEQFAEAGHGR